MEIGEAGDSAAKLRATVDVVEFLGNEELLHLRVGDEDLVAIVDSSQRVKPGDVVDMYIPLEKLHLFDEENGLALDAAKPQQKKEAATAAA
jgi:multiple sugar transport system ATP-binding protein